MFRLLGPYRRLLIVLTVLAVLSNALTLFIPKLVAHGIDTYTQGSFDLPSLVSWFGGVTLGVFFFAFLQSVVQTFASEKVARDLRLTLVDKISRQGYRFIEERDPAKLLTNVTSDIDSIKVFVSQVIVSLVTSAVIIVGTAIILLTIHWKLALIVLTIIPLIGGSFFVILKKLRKYFIQGREVIDWLNKVIRENIVGAALVRVLDSGRFEHEKFGDANRRAREIGLIIVQHFALLVPIITFFASMATLMVVTLGGYYVIHGSMTLGSFTAFLSYVVVLIFPILIIGFMGSIIAQASASYKRINEVLQSPDEEEEGTLTTPLQRDVQVDKVSAFFGEKCVLKDVSFTIALGTKTAIIGPTAAGKTQLLNMLAGLSIPHSGSVKYDGRLLSEYERDSFFRQVGLVFQDSVLFNATIRENIAFSALATDDGLRLAVDTAELTSYIASLPQGLDAQVSERGTTLSGGQKQRIMLARALALNPRILFLDDFTARVDVLTESKILANISRNYPELTLVSITQKIAPIVDYDQIILLMEGEVLAQGTHDELMQQSPEYVQIYNSQRSTSTHEIRT
ncbi:MAG: ABC transporter ATP-binding protein [Pirellulaceae bacterium]|jgi:ATP-binding cassette subfamily B protein|nr:ABC transporter ATP-binding protein [Pirellulaceae bacterium]